MKGNLEQPALMPEAECFRQLAEKCREIQTSFLLAVLRHFYFRLRGKSILTSNRVKINGLQNIFTKEFLTIGLSHYGFMHKMDRTFLNIDGKLIFTGSFSMGKGCRFDIGPKAEVKFSSGYMSPNTDVILVHGMTVGDGCAISWGCQFLDDDFHDLDYEGRREPGNPHIHIGSHVWIGSRVTVLKGAVIPDGCVVASNSVVNKPFTEKNCLLGGNPAKVIRRNVNWE